MGISVFLMTPKIDFNAHCTLEKSTDFVENQKKIFIQYMHVNKKVRHN